MDHAVRTPDHRRKPETAIIVGVVGSLDNQLRLAVHREGINRVPNKRTITARRAMRHVCAACAADHICAANRTRTAQILPVHKYTGGAEWFLKVKGHHALPL